MKELRKAAGRALVALLQNDPKTALAALNVYKVCMDDGEPILTPGTMNPPGLGNAGALVGREVWAIGLAQGDDVFGMTHGPVPSISDMLDVDMSAYALQGHSPCIIHFFGDGTEEITHRWKATTVGGEWATVKD